MDREQRKAYRAAYYQANKEKVAAYGKAYRQANREKLLAYDREYNKNNKERRAYNRAYRQTDKFKKQSKAYREANKEKIAARCKRWAEANKDRRNEYYRQYYRKRHPKPEYNKAQQAYIDKLKYYLPDDWPLYVDKDKLASLAKPEANKSSLDANKLITNTTQGHKESFQNEKF